jgi:hypothetical protein
MKCSLLTLSCALDGELSQERQAELETHLVTCERCRSGMRYLREETERISQLARAHVPPGSATAILERARVLAPEGAGNAALPPPNPDPVAVVEVPPLDGSPESDITKSASVPDLTLWGPGVAGASAGGALDSIAVAGFPAPGEAPEVPTEPEEGPKAGLLEPEATPEDYGVSPEEAPSDEAGGRDSAASIEDDIAPWSAEPELTQDQGVGEGAEDQLSAAQTAGQEPVADPESSAWAASPLTDAVAHLPEEDWVPGAADGPPQPVPPGPDAVGAEAVAEGTRLAPSTSDDSVESLDPTFQDGPAASDTPLVEYEPLSEDLWASDGSGPLAAEPPPPGGEGMAPLEPAGDVFLGGALSGELTPPSWGSQPEGPQPELPPAVNLTDQPIESGAVDFPAAAGYSDPILGDGWGAPPAQSAPPGPDVLPVPSAPPEPMVVDQPPEPADAPADNPWTAAADGRGPADPADPWQRSWEPDPLPVWSPALPPIPPWPGEPPTAGAEEGSSDEVMEVAKEEAAGLEEPAAPAEVPVWIPPPPSLPSSVTDGWVPKRDLLDIPVQSPEPKAAVPPPPSVRPVDSVVPPRRPPTEETTGYQRIPPPHRPGGPGKRPVTPRPAAPLPRSWARTGTIAVAALAVFLIGWALTHHTAPTPAPTRTAHSSPTPNVSHSPGASPSAPATTAPALNLTGEQTFGGGGSGYQMQTARYGLHQNGTQLWVVFQMVSGTGSPKITTGFDGPTTLYVEMQGVAPGVAVPQPPSGELVTGVKVGQVPGFTGAVYILQLSRAAQVSGYLLPGTDSGSAGERVVLQLQ